MSNKTQLQQNNTELQAHLQDILGLPTAAEIAAGASTGQYVWKKYQYTPEQTVTDVHMTSANITDSNKMQFVLASNMCDLTKVDASFFVGAAFSVTSTNNQTFSATIVSATKANSTSHSNYTCTLAYNPDTKTLTATIDGSTLMSGWTYSSGTFVLSSATIPAQKEFVSYVVSDSPTAYPNDGVQDGYWYENLVLSILKFFGCTKISIDTFTLPNNTDYRKETDLNINHSLGVIPKIVIVAGNIEPAPMDDAVSLMFGAAVTGGFDLGSYRSILSPTFAHRMIKDSYITKYARADTIYTFYIKNASESMVNIYHAGHDNYKTFLVGGVEYALITMA